MLKRVIIRNGKKYIVNIPSFSEDVGSAAPAGTLWMQSITDGNWYAVTLAGTSASAALAINQTPLALTTNDLGYQLVLGSGSVYQVYLSGSSSAVVAKTAVWPINDDYKPYLWLQSDDGNFYNVNISGSSLEVDQNSKWWPSCPNAIPPYSISY